MVHSTDMLTRVESEALDELVLAMSSFYGVEGESSGLGAVPERVTIEPDNLGVFERVNALLVEALASLSERADRGLRKDMARVLADNLASLTTDARATLSKPGRQAPLILAGADAKAYFAVLEWAHARWSVIRRNAIETARDARRAEAETAEALWAIRSILNVGHLPEERSRFLHPGDR